MNERENKWNEIYDEFSSSIISFKGYQNFKKNMWQKQLHIYEVPFYYIEYGIAQLGAIAIWRNFKLNKEKSIDEQLDDQIEKILRDKEKVQKKFSLLVNKK